MQYLSKFLILTLTSTLITILPSCKSGKQPHKKAAVNTKEKKEEKTYKTFVKKIPQLSFEEAQEARKYYTALGKKPQVAQALERMISLSKDHAIIDNLLIELADIKFELELYAEAEERYKQHMTLYPGSSKIQYITKQRIESAFKQINDAHRDQTKTKDVIALIDNYLKTFGSTKRLNHLLTTCYYHLFESELNQAAFYIKKYNYTSRPSTLISARQRLLYLRDTVLNHLNEKTTQKLIEQITALEKTEKTSVTQEQLQTIIDYGYNIVNNFTTTTEPEPSKNVRDRF